jgi:hypothetical protein
MMDPYRSAPPKEPDPRRSWWCRLGVHQWSVVGYGYVGWHLLGCRRECTAKRWLDKH